MTEELERRLAGLRPFQASDAFLEECLRRLGSHTRRVPRSVQWWAMAAMLVASLALNGFLLGSPSDTGREFVPQVKPQPGSLSVHAEVIYVPGWDEPITRQYVEL